VKEKLRKAGVEPAVISSTDSASDNDQTNTSHVYYATYFLTCLLLILVGMCSVFWLF